MSAQIKLDENFALKARIARLERQVAELFYALEQAAVPRHNLTQQQATDYLSSLMRERSGRRDDEFVTTDRTGPSGQ